MEITLWSDGDPRFVPLGDGDLRWLFPGLVDPVEAASVRGVLCAADDAVSRVGRRLGALPGGTMMGVTMNRLVFERFPMATDIMTCAGSAQVFVDARLWFPRTRLRDLRSGPPWVVDAEISLPCDVDREFCAGHEVDRWRERFVETPLEAADELLEAVTWLLECVTAGSVASLRARDRQSGHEVTRSERD